MNHTAKIAADALSQLRLGRIEPGSVYLTHRLEKERKLLTLGEIKQATCSVCAKGALLYSHLSAQPEGELFGDIYERLDQLGELFGADQWTLIETCYEGWDGGDGVTGRRYLGRYTRRYDRLEAILENTVRNGGTFIPDQDLEAVAA